MRTLKIYSLKQALLYFFILLFSSHLLAQSLTNDCGFDHLHTRSLLEKPAYRERCEKAEQQFFHKMISLAEKSTKESNDEQQRISTVYTIPVVIHVMHLGETEGTGSNISNTQIQTGIDHLNDAFRNVNGYAGGPYHSDAGISSSDVEIEFCLAVRSPDGGNTTGINRINTTYSNIDRDDPCTPVSGSDTQDDCMKALSFWDSNNYLNIWIVNEICTSSGTGCGVAGYAYTAGAHGELYDGVVTEAAYFGSSEDNSKVHIHEVGHYLNLLHTFTDDCLETDCLTGGDRICDTPPDQSSTAVNCTTSATANTCSTDASITNSPFASDVQDIYENYMDYGYLQCQNTFTPNQTTRMRTALTGTRASLLSSTGCTTPAVPVSNFTASTTATCEGSVVTFTDASTNGTSSWSWTFPGGTPSSSTDQNPTVTYSTSGTYDVTLVASNPIGTGSTETKTDYISTFADPVSVCAITTSNANTTGNTFGIGIYNVTVGSINKTTSGTVNDGTIYQDFACDNVTSFETSTTYSLTVTVGGANPENIKAFIDYNNNGDFSDAGEEIYNVSGIMGTAPSHDFTTPSTVTEDRILTLRVMSDFSAISTSCTTPTYGQVEDYGVYFASSPLPVQLISFNGFQNNETVQLNWETASELNNDYFTLEHSLDGNNFEFLERIRGNGNSVTVHQYQYNHLNPVQGNNYYRLSQTDLDGTQKVVGIKVIDFRTEKKEPKIFPNPIQDGVLSLKYPSLSDQPLDLQVFDVAGKVLLQKTESVQEGNNHLALPIQNLAAGVYWLRTLEGDDITKTIRFVKMD